MPVLDWPQMLRLINAYASHVADAAQHQAASRADISQAAALKTLTDIRMAMAAHTSRWQALVHELIWRAAPPAAAAPQAQAVRAPLTDTELTVEFSRPCYQSEDLFDWFEAGARFAERAHGITAAPSQQGE